MTGSNPHHTELGRSSEAGAARWLTARGARILERNYRTRGGEIDLIVEWPPAAVAAGGRVDLVFVEVRARVTQGRWVEAQDTVTFPKQRRIERAAAVYLARYTGPARSVRFDILAWDGCAWTHIRRAWR